MQAADEARLRAAVSDKRFALDAIKEAVAAEEARLDRLRLDAADAAALTEGTSRPAAARAAGLAARLAEVEAVLARDEARQASYAALEARTARDHAAALASARGTQ